MGMTAKKAANGN